MRERFETEEQVIPSYIMENLRERRSLEYDDATEDDDILSMSGSEFLDELLNWEGIIGYTNIIMEYIEMAFGIDLNEIDAPNRIREDEQYEIKSL